MADQSKPSLPDPNIVRGWFAITTIVKLSENTCRKLAEWGRSNRLPIFEDHRGPLARVSELERWMADQFLPFGVRERMGMKTQKRRGLKGRGDSRS